MADKQMDPEDYRLLKTACSVQIAELEVRLAAQAEKQVDIQPLLTRAANWMNYTPTAPSLKSERSSVRYILKSSFLTATNIEPLD